MIHAKCFTEYTPDEPKFGMGILYLRDDAGSDWYELQAKFSDATIKVAYSTNGVICALSSDVTTICPNNLSVVEMASNQVPSECVADGFWLYIDGDIIHNDELQNSVLKHQLMQKSSIIIQPLQDAFDLGIATDEEKASLSAWKNYRVLLNRVDTNSESIEWPVEPEV